MGSQFETPQLPEWHIGKKDILVNIVDFTARKAPRVLYAEFPILPTSYEPGFRKITYGDLANAVNGVAWWLEKLLGKGRNFETLAYVGPNDMRYNVMVLGAVKAGYKASSL
jgi:acyl-coenzyme A synthetase/AMP-(fatty) acid ligase